ncbi:MAG: hypothetical protein P0Y53_18765 [Candidatus Pseudobacter hemicellulosilyticus]|uniref:Xaa-Pro aminopeptidase n=1 Tax=Candidatus Pseudobacter hemicellulosilyticus TaxID=3121375 RepID=A0AAJ6BEX5_9BACT|nr:MAG: hypothetical protein P0Y53_18765 [Pseudobacter sp.]
MNNPGVFLKEIDWPDFGQAPPVTAPTAGELQTRLQLCREMMTERGLTHLVVYADREHSGNLLYLTHFDPRFEEALLILNRTNTPLLLVGNECVGHLPVSPLYNAGGLRYERYQPFSLLSQPRNDSRSLAAILKSEGIQPGSRVGCIGWKYFTAAEFPEPELAIELPAIIVDVLRSLCGREQVVNASDILLSPAYGLKASCSVYEIAQFELSNIMASEGMKRLLQNFRYGITDFELVQEYQYTGYPLGCHIGMKSSGNQHIGLSSPVGALIRKGDPCSTNLSYWGSNSCRAGWVAASADDLPEAARDYVERFAGPYFYACAQWLQQLKIGAKGRDLYQLVQDLLPFDQFAVFLNPGHLIHFEEWTSSPIYEGSEDTIRSGMYLQVDIIPRSKTYFSSRMEDGVVIADAALRQALQQQYPAVYERCRTRRQFMIDTLGIQLPEEVLPLSNIPGIVPPFFLDHRTVLSLKN